MTSHDLIAGLWRDEAAAFPRVLQNCRFEGFGGSAYGGEAIREVFRRWARPAAEVEVAATRSAAAAFGLDAQGRPAALFADLHEGWVSRLWRLGAEGGAGGGAASTAVPADLDRDQRSGRVAFRADDHPELSPAGAAQVQALGAVWLAEPPPGAAGALARARPMVLRAVSQGARTAVLVRIEGSSCSGLAGAYAAALLEGAESRTVVDLAGLQAALAAPWTPRLR